MTQICKATKNFLHCEEVNIYTLDHIKDELKLASTTSKKNLILVNNKNFKIKLGDGLVGECAKNNEIINKKIPDATFEKIRKRREGSKKFKSTTLFTPDIEGEQKKLDIFGIKESKNCILVPIKNINGAVDGIQFFL